MLPTRPETDRFSLENTAINPAEFYPAEIGQGNIFNLPQRYKQSQFLTTRINTYLTVTQSSCVSDQSRKTRIVHTPNSVLLVFGQGGTTQFSLGDHGEKIIVQENDVWFFAPRGQSIIRYQKANESSSMFVVKLDLNPELDLFAKVNEGLERLPPGLHKLEGLLSLPRALRESIVQPNENASEILIKEGRCLELFGIAFQEVIPQSNQIENRDSAIFRKVQNMLLDRMDNPPSLAKLSNECGTNHVKLNQIFTRMTGKTVFSYYRHARLHKAASELQNTSHTITEIALSHGFSSSSHFATAFAQMYGSTPGQFRALKKS